MIILARRFNQYFKVYMLLISITSKVTYFLSFLGMLIVAACIPHVRTTQIRGKNQVAVIETCAQLLLFIKNGILKHIAVIGSIGLIDGYHMQNIIFL